MRILCDRQFCSDAHREMFRKPSARALRNHPDLNNEFEEVWLDSSPRRARKPGSSSGAGQSAATALGIIVLGIVVVTMMGQPRQRATSESGNRPGGTHMWNSVQEAFERIPGMKPQVRLREDFSGGLRRWQGSGTSDWSFSNTGVKLGAMRIWEDSKNLTDYRLEFEGRIEKKSLGWAFRANDLHNYYASKINLSRTPGSRTAEIVRFSVLRGHDSKRIALPLPIAINKDTFYHVQVKIKGDKFITAIDGQVVDVWQDSRIAKGGIGFFNEIGDSASIRWVSVSGADRFLEKLRSYLYLSFIAPTAPLF